MSYVFENYDDNLDEEKLSTIPTERLQAIVDSCDRAGNKTLCEVCRFYTCVIDKRKK